MWAILVLISLLILNSFNYVDGNLSITKNINIGYVYNYYDRDEFNRSIGWQTAISLVCSLKFLASTMLLKIACF